MIELADQTLQDQPDNLVASCFKAKALAFTRKYAEARTLIAKLVNASLPESMASDIKTVDEQCSKVLAFMALYNSDRASVSEVPATWYADRLNQHVLDTTQLVQEESMETRSGSDEVFIVGPPEVLETFHGYDFGVYRKLQSKVDPYPNAQATRQGWMYCHDQTYPLLWIYGDLKADQFEDWKSNYLTNFMTFSPRFLTPFPVTDNERTPIDFRRAGEPARDNNVLDVFYSYTGIEQDTHNMLQWSLDQIAKQTQDFFVPMYQNIIDPNLTAVDNSPWQWTATNFVITQQAIPAIELVVAMQCTVKRLIGRQMPWHTVCLIFEMAGDAKGVKGSMHIHSTAQIASQISTLPFSEHPELYLSVQNVLTAALPLLSRLRRPALLFPGHLQAVVKAQRIYLNPGEEYEGVWHYDGMNERIIAVVLYFYRYSPGMEGGTLEFLARQPKFEEFWHDDNEIDANAVREWFAEVPSGKVDVQKGLLCVFSNYQSIHRVLKMVYPDTCAGDPNAPGGVASRDFLAMFIVDQRHPLESTEQAIATGRLPEETVRTDVRKKLFYEQLEPNGEFGYSEELVCSTGNGACGLIGWLQKNQLEERYFDPEEFEETIGIKYLNAMNFSPPLGRGISWALDGSWMDLNQEDEDQ